MAETANRAERTLSEAMHEVVTIWMNQGQEIVEKTVKAVDEINGAFGNAYSTATEGALDCGAKVTHAMRTNILNVFDVAVDLMSVKSLPQAIEISTTGVRKQFDALAAQSQEWGHSLKS